MAYSNGLVGGINNLNNIKNEKIKFERENDKIKIQLENRNLYLDEHVLEERLK